MESLFLIKEKEVLAFGFVLLRTSAFVVTWPVFGVAYVPQLTKVLFALMLALLVFGLIDKSAVPETLDAGATIWLAGREVLYGVAFGFLARLFFFIMSVAGELISYFIGLSNAELMNPMTFDRSSTMDQFQMILGTLLFLALNGHLLLLGGLVDSFQLFPIGTASLPTATAVSWGGVLAEVTELGLKLSAPVLVAILLMNIALGVIGKAVPQINILITSMPINVLLGFMVLLMALPFIFTQSQNALDWSLTETFRRMRGSW